MQDTSFTPVSPILIPSPSLWLGSVGCPQVCLGYQLLFSLFWDVESPAPPAWWFSPLSNQIRHVRSIIQNPPTHTTHETNDALTDYASS
jgi:hypothetical protein